jgi:hypothetical protein
MYSKLILALGVATVAFIALPIADAAAGGTKRRTSNGIMRLGGPGTNGNGAVRLLRPVDLAGEERFTTANVPSSLASTRDQDIFRLRLALARH